jgi:hypothetical protein
VKCGDKALNVALYNNKAHVNLLLGEASSWRDRRRGRSFHRQQQQQQVVVVQPLQRPKCVCVVL